MKCAARRAVCLALGGLLLLAIPASAQTGDGRVEVGGGMMWLGGTPFDPVPATETSLSSGRLTLFNSDTELLAASGIEARIGLRLSSMLQVEGTVSYIRPQLQTRITSDAEGIPDVTLSDTVTEYTFEGGITAQLARWSVGRLAPFASGGAGYLRQLHDGRRLIETGRTYYVGGGFRYPLSMRRVGLAKASGLRVDARAEFRKDGVALDEKMHTVPALGASFFVSF